MRRLLRTARGGHPIFSRATARSTAIATIVAATLLLAAACGPAKPPPRTPEQVRAQLMVLLPGGVRDRGGWATDIQVAFTAIGVEPSDSNLCAAIAVTQQESTFTADPEVPGLGRIAVEEIERRAAKYKVPKFAVRAALLIDSPDGRSYAERFRTVRTEKQLSELYEEMIAQVPMGSRLLKNANPVRTGGPMQVSIAFAEQYAAGRPYPYADVSSIRHEVFTRRGGMYFGIAHLLDYPAPYDRPLYRFADFNAGFYASRNAAFQQAVAKLSGVPLVLDGDLILHDGKGDAVGATEAAVRSLAPRLDLSEAQIRRALKKSGRHAFEKTTLYRRVFELADREAGLRLPRAVMPRIDLKSPKITRQLTTEWFANRVDNRHRQCLARAQPRL